MAKQRRVATKVDLGKFERLQKAQSLLIKMLDGGTEEAREFGNYIKEHISPDELQFKIRGKKLMLSYKPRPIMRQFSVDSKGVVTAVDGSNRMQVADILKDKVEC
jgi:hypothetical protein